MDQYFERIEKVIIERKTSPKLRFMLQDIIDLRKVGRSSASRSLFNPTQMRFCLFIWNFCPTREFFTHFEITITGVELQI